MRTCNRCKAELPLEQFVKDASRPLGRAYECTPCHRERRKGRDRRKERWANMTKEQRARAQARNLRYSRTDRGRAVFLRKAYERVDACDFSSAEIAEIIAEPCTYCGTVAEPRGLDRIDNALPHIKGNVLPACATCNFARGDRLSVDEMKRVGALIREIMEGRHSG